MKCDELKVYVPKDGPYGLEPEEGGKLVEEETCYLKSDVEAAIDELKAEHHKERHEYIKMIAELKQKLEDAQATAYAESVDAGMRERKLKRSLWLDRAERAKAMKAIENLDNYLSLHKNSKWFGIYSTRIDTWYYKWDDVERKCRAKAERYGEGK